jgi:tetratricopeptide (TPR) repeat protein
LEKSFSIREQVLGPDHPDTAQSLNNLGALYYSEGDLSEAARLMRRALEIREARLGPDHPDTQSSRQSLANIEAHLRENDG